MLPDREVLPFVLDPATGLRLHSPRVYPRLDRPVARDDHLFRLDAAAFGVMTIVLSA